MELNNELKKMRRKAREAKNKNKNAEAKRTAGFLLLFIATSILIVAVVGCAEKDKSGVAAKEEPELPEMSAHAGDEVNIDEPIEYSATEDTFEITAGAAADEYPNLNTDVTEADAADVPQDAELVDLYVNDDDPYGMYQVPEEWTDNHDGAFLLRDGKKYALSKMVPEDVIDRYGVGCKTANAYTALYMEDQIDQGSLDVPTKTPECIIACGDFPILQIRGDDTILGYGSCTTLYIEKMSFVGYTIEAVRRTSDTSLTYYPLVDHALVPSSVSLYDGAMQKTGVYDLNDNPVEDIHDLNYGQEYLFEYYLGAEYHEIRKIANCRCYTPEGSEKQRIDGELTKNGYVTFDFSVLEPGIYGDGSSVFEIVE